MNRRRAVATPSCALLPPFAGAGRNFPPVGIVRFVMGGNVRIAGKGAAKQNSIIRFLAERARN
jgi:hypothetical protein